MKNFISINKLKILLGMLFIALLLNSKQASAKIVVVTLTADFNTNTITSSVANITGICTPTDTLGLYFKPIAGKTATYFLTVGGVTFSGTTLIPITISQSTSGKQNVYGILSGGPPNILDLPGTQDFPNVTIAPDPDLLLTPTIVTICGFSPKVNFKATSVYATLVQWSTGATTDTISFKNVSNSAIYTVTGYDGSCTTTRKAEIKVFPNPEIDAGGTVYRCFESSLQLEAKDIVPGAEIFKWAPAYQLNNINIRSPLVAQNGSFLTQTYTVTGTSPNGCKDTSTVKVIVNLPIKTDITNTNPLVLCRSAIQLLNTTSTGGSPFTPDPKYIYSWSPKIGLNDSTLEKPTLSVNAWSGLKDTTSYRFTITDKNKCTASSKILVSVTGVDVSFDPNVASISACSGSRANLKIKKSKGTSPYNIKWAPEGILTIVNDDERNTTPLSSSSFVNVTVTDGQNCFDIASISIDITPPPVPNLGDKLLQLCAGFGKQLSDATPTGDTSSDYAFKWSPTTNITNPTSATPIFTSTTTETSTIYTLTVTSIVTGCSGIDSLTVNTKTAPNIKISPISKTLINTETEFSSNAAEDVNLQWRFEADSIIKTDRKPKYTFNTLGYFTVNLKATNSFGCTAVDSTEIRVIPPVTRQIYVPNVFSPASTDARNKSLRVFGRSDEIEDFSFTVFNIFGQKVFESKNFQQMADLGWNGDNAPAGVYTYVINAKFIDGESFDQEKEDPNKYRVTLLK